MLTFLNLSYSQCKYFTKDFITCNFLNACFQIYKVLNGGTERNIDYLRTKAFKR